MLRQSTASFGVDWYLGHIPTANSTLKARPEMRYEEDSPKSHSLAFSGACWDLPQMEDTFSKQEDPSTTLWSCRWHSSLYYSKDWDSCSECIEKNWPTWSGKHRNFLRMHMKPLLTNLRWLSSCERQLQARRKWVAQTEGRQEGQ